MFNKLKIALSILEIFLVSIMFANNILMSLDFNTLTTKGVVNGRGKFANTEYMVFDKANSIEIVQDDSKNRVLRIGRKNKVGGIVFGTNQAIQYQDNFQVSFDVKVPSNRYATIFIENKNNALIGAVNLIGGASLRAYDQKRKWVNSNLPVIPSNQWVNVAIAFNGNKKSYDITVTYPNKIVKTSTKRFPYLGKINVSKLRFLNGLPVGSSYLINNVKLIWQKKVTSRKENVKFVLNQSFDKDFKLGAITKTLGSASDCNYVLHASKNNYSIVKDPAKSKPYALKVLRDGINGYLGLRPKLQIPKNRDFTIEFNAYTNPASGTVMQMADSKGKILGGVLLLGELKGYNKLMNWERCNVNIPILPSKQWINIKIKVNVNQACYTISATFPDGKVYEGVTLHPLLGENPITELRFVNILPQKSFVFIDDVKMYYNDTVSIIGRDNFSPNATSRIASFEQMLKGKSPYKISTSDAELEISPAATINALLFSGKKLPKKVTVNALNAGGHWKTVGINMPINPKNPLLEFKTIDQIVKLTFQFKDYKGCDLTSLAVLSPVKSSQVLLDSQWSKLLDAEYDLPVYDRQYPGCNVALLTFVNHTNAPLNVKVVMHERLKNKLFRKFNYKVPVGRSNYSIKLDNVPNGEYLTTISDASKKDSGKIVRLLRHCTSPKLSVKPRKEMTGEKIYFPDKFFLDDCKNIHFTTGVAKPYLVKLGTTKNDAWITFATDMGIDNKGNIVINFRTTNRLWQKKTIKKYHAIGAFDNLNNWQIKDGWVKINKKTNVLTGNVPAAAKSDWGKKYGPDGKIKYRFYNPVKDGPIKLNQLYCEYITEAKAGTVEHSDYDWTVMRPSPQHVWTVWYKSPGEALIVGKRSLVSGFLTRGNIELPNSGSDLRFGQYLSDDGKTLYLGFGRHLARFMPYRAEYDNLTDRARIVGIWRTKDGIHWEQGFVAPPDKSKPLADQHYGGKDIRLPNGAGLRIAILCRYSAYTQQISWEVVYSWDGFLWTRFQREPQFLPSGPFGSWNHGGGYISDSAIEYKGKTYQLMFWITDHYHFQSEIVHGSVNSVDHMTTKYMKARYSKRKLEKWPFFKKYFNNSWEKLAEHTRNAKTSIGVMEYRYDGFFFASAKDKEARMLTKTINASKSLAMNAVIHQGGFIEVSLFNKNGKINGFSKRFESGDNTKWKIFNQLPLGDFQIEIKMKNADIYTLNF